MSEVYIRSQNKEKLYRLGGNYACVEYDGRAAAYILREYQTHTL